MPSHMLHCCRSGRVTCLPPAVYTARDIFGWSGDRPPSPRAAPSAAKGPRCVGSAQALATTHSITRKPLGSVTGGSQGTDNPASWTFQEQLKALGLDENTVRKWFINDRRRTIRERAFFLWENESGKRWWDPASNWLEAEKSELSDAIETTAAASIPAHLTTCTSLVTSRGSPSLLLRRNSILQRQADESLIRQSCMRGALTHGIVKFFG
jgi:hypothetical protein